MRDCLKLALSLALAATPCLANQVENANTAVFTYNPPVPGPTWSMPRAVLYDNGPLVNSPGTGFGGADESVLQSNLGMNTLGFGHQAQLQYLVTDDFTVPPGDSWNISTITFFAYQTNAVTNPSTMTAVYVEIWNGVPDAPGAVRIFGDKTTNRLVSSQWSNIYRVSSTAQGATNRPIMANVCSAPVVLGPGTYWIAWMTDGTLSSGPWAPPITINGQTTTGNGEQSLDNGATFEPALDSGTSTPQGFPFVIEGTSGSTSVEEKSWGAVKSQFRR
ncbi:MAG: hypothetical protein FJY73_04965 [Candidatus Eisenbacteria bacterium]|nr:hypothetical protein [Candidatus Eisenbacteria bacterium]